MKPALHWHEFAPSRLARERTILASLPYFTRERTYFDERYFKGVGTVHHRGTRSGRLYELRIMMEYPRNFPRTLPRVFDHDHVFEPSLDGHLFSTHEICLTLPERNEFNTTSDYLTEEILSATLIWFHKRRLFERNRVWPGPAERHGVHAVIDLLIEQQMITDEETILAWLRAHACGSAGNYRAPDRYAPCPCGSEKALKFCHEESLKPLFARLSRITAPSLLASALKTK